MNSLLRATEVFFDHLSAVEWPYIGLALAFHLVKMVARAYAWRNIVAASYPLAIVRWRTVFGSYAAGVGVNAVVPARGGDLLKLYLIRDRVDGASYSTLAATLVVEAIFDVVVASLLLLWAIERDLLPGLGGIRRLPEVDWLWLLQHPTVAIVIGFLAVVATFSIAVWVLRRVESFAQRVARGFAVMRPPNRYLRQVVPWQAVDWACRLASLYFFLHAFGLPADLHNALLVQLTNSVSTALPLTPAGIGTEQALLVYVFSGTASAAAVLTFSVGVKFAVVSVNAVLGFGAVAAMLRTLRWRRVVHDGAPTNEQVPEQRDSIAASRGPRCT